MPNTKISTLVDAFTATSINTTLWGTITAGTATLDAVNDQVVLAVPTTAATNTFGTGATLYDATSSSVYAQVTAAPRGNGNTRTIMRLRLDSSNSISIRVESGVFRLVLTTAGVDAATTLPTYNADTHRWWRLREAATTFYADASPDGLTWTTLASTAYTWDATQVSLRFESAATATEVPGNASTIAHVNTRLGGQANPNWPLLEYGAGLWWGANNAVSPLDLYVDVSQRTEDAVTVGRGRQYTLDQVRAAEQSATLTNTDGSLDPVSTSVYPSRVQPFQPFRTRAQWPPTVNLLTQGVATGGDIGGITAGTISPSAALDLLSDTDTTGGSVLSSASAWLGSHVTQFTVPSSTAAGQRITHCAQVAVLPGQTYALQIRLRNVTASTSVQVKAHLGWYSSGSSTPSTYTYGSTATLSGSATAAWTTITVTGTAPAGTYGIDVGVSVAATVAATCSVQTDGWQLEKGPVASAWMPPGTWYPIASTFTEDWESRWDLSGTFGTVGVPSADALALLSQQTLSDSLTEEISTRSPRFLYTLADPDGSAAATDTTGTYPAASIAISKYGAGTLTFGNAITAASSAGIYTGSTGTVATLANPNPGTGGNQAASFLSLSAAGITGPASTAWSRMIAFQYTGATPSVDADIWCALDKLHAAIPSDQVRLYIDSNGYPNLLVSSYTAGASLGVTVSTSVVDSNWHLLIAGYNTATNQAFISLDGAYHGTVSASSLQVSSVYSDSIGAYVDGANGNAASNNFAGAVSYAAEFPSMLTSTDCTQIYAAWRSACAGESTDARYARILRYAGYTGPTSLQAGQTASMGPATIGGQDAVSALAAVVETEGGEHFIARDGTPTFKSRAARYNATTPACIFGERTELREWPYEDLQTVWDSTRLGNQVTVTNGDGQEFYARDTASQAAYFPRTLTRTVNSSNTLECQDAADYLLSRYKSPFTRVATLALRPAASPALWPVCLGLELGTRVRVMRRPQGLPAVQIECFIENIAWTLDTDNNATVVLQCSPADTLTYGVFAAWHTTLNANVAPGNASITVNASQDNTNSLASQLAPGQQLVLGQNTANRETVTAQSVGATSPGWTTAVVTLSAPAANAHSVGDLVNEPLPAGVTDPAIYDASSAFGTAVFAY